MRTARGHFDLKDQLDHVAGGGENTALRTSANGSTSVSSIDFSSIITATDADGDTVAGAAQGAFTIAVQDDAPITRADRDSVTEDGITIVTGNVITDNDHVAIDDDGNAATSAATDGADTLGADGGSLTGVQFGSVAQASGSVGVPVAGTYGSITIGANGAYTYTLNNGSPNVQALAAGQQVTDTFTYTVTDGDGDMSTTTIQVTIVGSADAPKITIGGDDCTPEDTTMSPSFTATPVDALSSVTQIVVSGLSGWNITPGPVTVSSGTGIAAFVAGVLTITITGAAAGTAVTATVPMTPPANTDVDASILVNATSTYNGTPTTSADIPAILYVDAVADAPTAVDITVADSADFRGRLSASVSRAPFMCMRCSAISMVPKRIR